ncbi:MAG TPA: radical SAM protein [Deltaproteobacteria bacterium]|nr:radical SAM protein [Deltaproteobacteria bacterium]
MYESGELARRVERALASLADCALCPRECHVNRLQNEFAVCKTGRYARVSSFFPHFGEEDCLRGWSGSGTIFFAWCNLRCVFCQNWEISQKGLGREVDAGELAGIMLALQAAGCHNVNLVTPSHVVAQILEALGLAAERGLRIPVVYNTGGFDGPEALALLDGVVDIYMPDMKYGDSEVAHRYSHVRGYVEVNQVAVREMHRQVGDLVVDEDGVARRGLLVRHLVLPGNLANTERVFAFLAHEISPRTHVNLMAQYRPCYRADDCPPLDRWITAEEWNAAVAVARRYGLPLVDGPA